MTRRVRHLIAPVAALAALALPITATAGPSAVVRDCAADGSVDGNHSDEDKRAALGQIPADLDEYSDCRSVIAASIKGKGPRAGAASSSPGGSGGQAVPSTVRPDRPGSGTKGAKGKRKRKRTKDRARTELLVDRQSLEPATAGVFDRESTANGLPLPALLALIALSLLLAAGGLYALARRNPGMLAALRRVPLPRRR